MRCESAASSLDFDTNDKRLTSARAGIREYWVVDINGHRLLVYRDLQAGDDAPRQALGPADAVSPLAAPGRWPASPTCSFDHCRAGGATAACYPNWDIALPAEDAPCRC